MSKVVISKMACHRRVQHFSRGFSDTNNIQKMANKNILHLDRDFPGTLKFGGDLTLHRNEMCGEQQQKANTRNHTCVKAC